MLLEHGVEIDRPTLRSRVGATSDLKNEAELLEHAERQSEFGLCLSGLQLTDRLASDAGAMRKLRLAEREIFPAAPHGSREIVR